MPLTRSMAKGRVQQLSEKRKAGTKKGPPSVPRKKTKVPTDDEDDKLKSGAGSGSGSKGAKGEGPPQKSLANSMTEDDSLDEENEVGESSGRKRQKCSQDEPPFVQNDQALMNDLVLTSLFGYLRGKDLKSGRLVCKKWNTLTLPFARSRFIVYIQDRDADNWPNPHGIGTFVNLIESNTLGIPFGKFYLSSFDTTQGVGRKFLQLCGETVKEIILEEGYVYKIENISMLLRSFPNLQSFTLPRSMYFKDSNIVKLFPENTRPKLTFLKSLNVPRFYSESITKKCPTFYEELFETTENISTLDLKPFSSESGLKILEIVGKPGRGAGIEKLIIEDITAKVLDFLLGMVRRGLELKQLDCGFNESNANSVDWFQLIKSFKNSLTYLKLTSYIPNPIRSVNFERMLKLKKLKFYGHIPINLNPGSQNFNNVFPILEKLVLRFIRDETEFYELFSGDEDYPCLTITSFKISTIPMKMENLNRILTIFPYLKGLKCEVREGEVMRRIWTHMPQLEELDISGTLGPTENVDSFFTGIPVEEIKRMDTKNFFDLLPQKMENRRERILMETNKYSTLPSIRNLTNLRSLTLSFYSERSGSEKSNSLTHLTGYLGLYSLKTLRHLRIFSSDISRTCADVLTEDLSLHTWKFSITYPPGSFSGRCLHPSAYEIKSK